MSGFSNLTKYGQGNKNSINKAVDNAVNGGRSPNKKRLGNSKGPTISKNVHVDVGSEPGDLHAQWLAKQRKRK